MALCDTEEIKQMLAGLLAQAVPRRTERPANLAQRSRAAIREITRALGMRDHFRQFIRGAFDGRDLDELSRAELGWVASYVVKTSRLVSAAAPPPEPRSGSVVQLRERWLDGTGR